MTVIITHHGPSFTDEWKEPTKIENVRMVSAYPHNTKDGYAEIIVYYNDHTKENIRPDTLYAFTMVTE